MRLREGRLAGPASQSRGRLAGPCLWFAHDEVVEHFHLRLHAKPFRVRLSGRNATHLLLHGFAKLGRPQPILVEVDERVVQHQGRQPRVERVRQDDCGEDSKEVEVRQMAAEPSLALLLRQDVAVVARGEHRQRLLEQLAKGHVAIRGGRPATVAMSTPRADQIHQPARKVVLKPDVHKRRVPVESEQFERVSLLVAHGVALHHRRRLPHTRVEYDLQRLSANSARQHH